ncbi:MAG TPA: CHRD domain-containing protein [Methylomirabilota bacterium]|nr:CHRD domain-containing protein [Methylomirabilota bacterium]
MTITKIGLPVVVAAFLWTGAAIAAEQTYTATLDGAAEVPKVNSKATADATFTVSPDGKKIEYTLMVRDLDDVTMAHIHMGKAGKNGPIVVRLYPMSGSAKLIKGEENGQLAKGEITEASLMGPEKGKPLSVLVKAIQDGDAYVNIHTQEHKSGEIRGQVK